MWVDSVDDIAKKITAAGGSYVTGRKETNPNVYYEVKYKTPEGIVFDITESGWKGAVKEVKPASDVPTGHRFSKRTCKRPVRAVTCCPVGTAWLVRE